jgi:hypothetical protein
MRGAHRSAQGPSCEKEKIEGTAQHPARGMFIVDVAWLFSVWSGCAKFAVGQRIRGPLLAEWPARFNIQLVARGTYMPGLPDLF